MTNDVQTGGTGGSRTFLARLLVSLAAVAFVLLVHNYGVNLLPYQHLILSPEEIKADSSQPSFAYYYRFQAGVPDRVREMRSRLMILENGRPHTLRTIGVEELRIVGGDRFAHLDDRVAFSTSDNTDPHTNGRIYSIAWPVLYSNAVGRGSVLVLAICLAGLMVLRPVRKLPTASPLAGFSQWAWWTALVVFAAGLYCSTGTRAPYGITFAPYLDPATGYAYNQDHPHFRTMFDFVDGQPRKKWAGAIFMRRILYPVLAYPAMKLLGFEAGGVATSLLLNLAAFIGCGYWMRKRMGGRAAVMGAWLLATYPGFAYWVGMPYQYALIAPGSLLLTVALAEISDRASVRRTLGWSLVMGTLYLAYDFAPIFLPATLGLLLWRRRWSESAVALAAGVLPLLCWLVLLRGVFHQSLENSNSTIYRSVFGAFLGIKDWGQWLAALPRLWDTAAATFFGANFVFLPAVFLGVLAVNRWTSRVRLTASEIAVLTATGLLFGVINLAPEYGGTWNMSGSWISRIYQPVFPVLVFFVARWWQALPPLPPLRRWLLLAGLGAAAAGNLLVVFGPIAGNPLGVSGEVFYRFYTHTGGAKLPAYENNLRTLPPRTLGF